MSQDLLKKKIGKVVGWSSSSGAFFKHYYFGFTHQHKTIPGNSKFYQGLTNAYPQCASQNKLNPAAQ